MPTLQLRFPGGRYHATPWGYHVNEGHIEWPPSPWRLLRALIACGFTSQHWSEIPAAAQHLIYKLASVLPSYRLPETSAAHSRHFMPIGSLAMGREQTTLIFDTWANVGEDELALHWDCELDPEETQLLQTLAASLGYLGRSESWVEAKLITHGDHTNSEFNAFPHQENIRLGPQWEQVSIMAAVPPDEYIAWRGSVTDQIFNDYPLPAGRKAPARLLKDRAEAIAPYPPDLLSCLLKDTAWWKRHGWSQPPGSQRVLYWRRTDCLQVGVPRQSKPRPAERVTTMVLALSTRSGSHSALPACTRTLPQAELLHRAIVSRLSNGHKVECPELTGKDEFGRPLHTHHEHAYTLPVDLDGDGHLDHVIVYSRMGLSDLAQSAIRNLRRTWTKGSAEDIQLALVGYGELDILRRLPSPLKDGIEQLLGPTTGATIWESLTPFVPPRYVKANGKNTLQGQIDAELSSRLLPEVQKIDLVPTENLTRSFRHYVRCRTHGGTPPPVNVGYGLRLIFQRPIRGPLVLGYASHYGLGLFRSVTE